MRLSEMGFHPLKWARLFRYMDVCVSERMHACIFCLLNGTPFVALDINEIDGESDTKLTDLLRSFGVEDYCFSPANARPAEVWDMCLQIENVGWQWQAIERRIEALSDAQTDYLAQFATGQKQRDHAST